MMQHNVSIQARFRPEMLERVLRVVRHRGFQVCAMNMTPMTKKADFIWFNGEMVPWAEAKVHVMSHALHYGTSVFEGVRCYDSHKGPVVFRHREHMQRLRDSAKI